MRRPLRWCAGALALLLAVSIGAFAQEPCTLTVRPGESIQAAVDSAPEGAVICLPEGEWMEYVTIEKSLTLRGAGSDRTTIRGKSPDGPVVRVRRPAGVVTIQDLTLTGAQGGKFGHGLTAQDASVVRVSGCLVSANTCHGIVLLGHAQGIVSNSTIRDNLLNGVVTYQNAHALIIDSEIAHNGWSGVTVEIDAEADVAGCTIIGNGTGTGGIDVGIIVGDNARATITACTISENRNLGIGVRGSGQAVISGCKISESKGSATGGGDGIQVWDSAHATILGCVVFENERHGITLKDMAWAAIEGNRVFLNGSYGVALVERPYFDRDDVFRGYVSGKGNTIPDKDDPDANPSGGVCSAALRFLLTEEGGAIDRRE
jgi:parallel beta-helix repeat protein